MCLSKKIFYQYFVGFCPAWDSFSSNNILYVITYITQQNEITDIMLLDTNRQRLTELDIDRGAVAPNCFNSLMHNVPKCSDTL